jgi:Kef-type K+ transport system membrane component KefB
MEDEYPILLTLGALLVLGPFLKSLMQRLRVPALICYMLLGFAISLLDARWHFITPAFESTFAVLAQVGVVALLFRVGLKSHTDKLLEKLPTASLIWVGDVLTNLVAGFLVSRYALALPLVTSLVIATAFSATSVAVSVGVWSELGKLGTDAGQLLVDVAELDDLSGVLLLAVLLAVIPVLQLGNGEFLSLAGTTFLTVLAKLALFLAACYLFAHYLEARFTRFSRKVERSTTDLTITILGAGLVIAVIAGYLGFSLAIGALFAGLAFSRDPQAVQTDARFAYFYEFFTPFFFVHIGMQVDPGAVSNAFVLGVLLFLVAVLAKFIGVSGVAGLLIKKSDAVLLGISMMPRAEIALVVLYQCSKVGVDIVSEEVFAAMVFVSLASSIFAPLLLRRVLR